MEEGKIKILATGGGSGGHIIPVLAVIEKLKEFKSNIEFLYVGSRDGMEASMVPKKSIPFKGIYCGKLRRYISRENFTDIFRVLIGFFQSLSIVRSFKPSVIFCKGGYVTVPVGLAGGLMGIPLVAHESDTVPGLSNRILLRFVRKLSLGFPLNNYPLSIQKKSEYTGNPINPCVLEISKKSKDDAVRHFGFNLKEPVLLVTGGSQGARAINDAIWAIKDKLLETLQIIHICGNLDYEKLNNSLSDISSPLKNRYKLFAFLSDDMPQALLASDLVITRAGANTLSELIILKKPSIIIPLPKAANDHQRKNGRVLSDCGAALFIDQSQLTPELLMNNILRLFSDSHLLQDMSEKTALMAKPDSAELIAKTILDVAGVGEVKNEK